MMSFYCVVSIFLFLYFPWSLWHRNHSLASLCIFTTTSLLLHHHQQSHHHHPQNHNNLSHNSTPNLNSKRKSPCSKPQQPQSQQSHHYHHQTSKLEIPIIKEPNMNSKHKSPRHVLKAALRQQQPCRVASLNFSKATLRTMLSKSSSTQVGALSHSQVGSN